MRGQRVLFLVLGHAVFVQMITYGMRPTLSYAVLDAGGAAALLGIVAASFAFPALLLALPFGYWVDRVGERSALVLGAALLIVAALVAAFAGGSIWLIIFATVLLGLGQVLSAIGEQAMIANTRGTGNSDSRFGFYAFAISLGQTVGPLLLTLPGGTVATPPLMLIFLCCAGLGVPTLLLSALLRSSPRLPTSSPVGMLTTAKTLIRTPGVVRALLAGSIVMASMDLFLAYVPALGHDRGLSAAVVGAMLAVRSMFSMISRLFLGVMIHWIGRRPVLVWTVAISAVALGCIALPLPAGWLIALAAAYGFAIGTCQPITMAWVSELSPSQSRGLAMSLRLAANRMGQTVLPATLGAFAAATGAAGVLVAVAAVLVMAAWSGAAVPNSSAYDEPPVETA